MCVHGKCPSSVNIRFVCVKTYGNAFHSPYRLYSSTSSAALVDSCCSDLCLCTGVSLCYHHHCSCGCEIEKTCKWARQYIAWNVYCILFGRQRTHSATKCISVRRHTLHWDSDYLGVWDWCFCWHSNLPTSLKRVNGGYDYCSIRVPIDITNSDCAELTN